MHNLQRISNQSKQIITKTINILPQNRPSLNPFEISHPATRTFFHPLSNLISNKGSIEDQDYHFDNLTFLLVHNKHINDMY